MMVAAGTLALMAFPGQEFTGKERDAETGLDYFGARYLASAQGRFTSPDPVKHPSGSKNPAAFLTNPQRWNGYSYVCNNPLRMVDPDGREEEESWLTMAKNYLAAMFQPVSSVDAMTNPRVAGEQNAPWPTDPHEIAVGATKEAGQRAELAFNVLSAMDPTGAGQLGKSMTEGSPGGVALAAMGVMIPGGRSGGNIALSEAKQLVGGWSANTSFGAKVGKSIGYHFGEHGAALVLNAGDAVIVSMLDVAAGLGEVMQPVDSTLESRRLETFGICQNFLESWSWRSTL